MAKFVGSDVGYSWSMNLIKPLCVLIFSLLPSLDVAFGGDSKTIKAKIESIDLLEHRITVSLPEVEQKLDLELVKKTQFFHKLVAVGARAMTPGNDATITYNTELMVASIIEFGDKLEIVNLDEINSPQKDFAPWVSPDGLEIYWCVTGRTGKNSIWYAKRKSPKTLFVDKRQIMAGHSPVLSADGLEIYFRTDDSPAIFRSTRNSRDEDFERPQSVESLTFLNRNATPSWLSDDRLTLYLDFDTAGITKRSSDEVKSSWVVKREAVNTEWQPPTQVEAQFEGMPKSFHFSFGSLSPDGLRMCCVSNHGIGVLSRSTPDGPFTQWDQIRLAGTDGQPLFCLRVQYVPATRELFLASNNLFIDPAVKKKHWLDLWIVKDFELPATSP